jgi:flagellar basal-body rod modification protein FlgD
MLINGNYATGNTGTGTGTGTTGTGTTGNTTGTGSTGSTGSTDTTGADSSGGVNGAATLGGANFLTLMLAQLKNQDPTSPVDSNTFLTQLAQLAQVQGINSLNTAFTSLSGSLTGNQALQASSLLGHQVLAASGTATTAAAGAAVTGAVSVPQTTAGVTLNISDASGALVKTITLGAQASGLASFTWDGTENNGSKAPAGTYTLAAQYAGQTQGGTAASTYVNGTVESVSMGGSSATTSSSSSSSGTTTGMTLNVSGVGSVPFSSVQQISN